MIIRKAELGDLRSLAELFDEYRVFYKKKSDVIEAKSFLQARIENKESEIFVSFNDENVMTGFTQLYPLFSSTRMQRFWLLNDLYVNANYRRQGFSVALIERAKKLCRDSGSCGMMLETAKSNVEGNKLYPKAGFELDKDHNYYEWST
ncbi:MAG: GNAT family N-acetyltransferase [Cyclobacteriaceae bacterium]